MTPWMIRGALVAVLGAAVIVPRNLVGEVGMYNALLGFLAYHLTLVAVIERRRWRRA